MKKYIFALLGALAMAFVPQSVNATDSCDITIASGETKTINYNVNVANNSNEVLETILFFIIALLVRSVYCAKIIKKIQITKPRMPNLF